MAGRYVEPSALDAAIAQRDRWIRLFNRLDAAVAHHYKRKHPAARGLRGWAAEEHVGDEHDEGLWAAHDRVLKSAAKRG